MRVEHIGDATLGGNVDLLFAVYRYMLRARECHQIGHSIIESVAVDMMDHTVAGRASVVSLPLNNGARHPNAGFSDFYVGPIFSALVLAYSNSPDRDPFFRFSPFLIFGVLRKADTTNALIPWLVAIFECIGWAHSLSVRVSLHPWFWDMCKPCFRVPFAAALFGAKPRGSLAIRFDQELFAAYFADFYYHVLSIAGTIGIVNAGSIDIACKRIADAYKQPRLFDDTELSAQTQTELDI